MPDLEKKDLWEELLDSYREHLAKQGRSRVSILAYLNPARKLMSFVKEKGAVKPRQIDAELIKEFQRYYLEKRDFNESTLKTYMCFIRVFFDFLISSGLTKENPVNGIELLTKPEAPKKQLAHFYIFEEILRRYLSDQRKWVSFAYSNQIEKHINGFFKYLAANEVKSAYSVTEAVLLKYREYLWDDFAQHSPHALVIDSQIERLRSVVRLFRYLYKEGILKDAPAKNLGWKQYYREIRERAKDLPKHELPQQELTGMEKLKVKFLDYELARGKSPKTTRQYKKGVEIFFGFLKERGIENLAQVNKRLLLDYYMYLCHYIGVRGQATSNGYKASKLYTMQLFFRFLVRFDYLAKDPSVDLESIRYEDGLPRTYMNEHEVFELLEQPHLNGNPLSLRDKAIMEMLFSTAIRSNELCCLNLEDIDQQQELVRINTPKGGNAHQRLIPIGKIALEYLNLYLTEARPQLENGDPKTLFLSYTGHRLINDSILSIVKKYVFKMGLRKQITTHSFRVTCATLMLKNGADIRYVQEQLGHKRITSTQVYTRLTPLDLKRIHSRTHPRERKINQGPKKEIFSAGVINSQPDLVGIAVNDSP